MRRFRRKPVTVAEIQVEENPVRKAYLLGYFLGYSGHLAWSGWSRELKERVLGEAEARNVLGPALDSFRKGRTEGASDRELDIMLGVYRPPVLEVEFARESARSAAERSGIFSMLSTRFTGEVRFLGFVRFSNSRDHLGIPPFLRRP
ncbi:hypothetical protein [Thermococcus prieurii]